MFSWNNFLSHLLIVFNEKYSLCSKKASFI
ncbi:CLUMA_CG001286, isoform A [Clunio marinus]|uniref:CLUMA_CG001286, isoform A n=1 Tax=Clunio marinus TaxID=568069 RepID=A0A1J1HHK5_9DIPT|nr:CLUMA_CG001286, isoform A [Clunio marinus]